MQLGVVYPIVCPRCGGSGQQRGITDDQVRTAIVVLVAYAAGDLRLENDLLDTLDGAIDTAYIMRPGTPGEEGELP